MHRPSDNNNKKDIKGTTRIVKIGQGHLREENLTLIITY
jgi:hypothetical protein